MDGRSMGPPGIAGLVVRWHYPLVGAMVGIFIAVHAFEDRSAPWVLALVMVPLNRMHDRWAPPARPAWLWVAVGIAVAAVFFAVFFSDAPGFGVWLCPAAGLLTFVLTVVAGHLAGRAAPD